SARHSSSSADVWWISSTTRVSRAVMGPSSNQRRAIPVVTITTFQVAVAGVASRSRLTTPPLRGACRVVVAVGQLAGALPVPVPAETDIALRPWGNPPGRETLGMLVPAGVQVLTPEGWGVIISFTEDGYVKDDDAAKIDYRELLRTMQQATHEANPERAKAGYATVELVGWAEPPRYDSVAHKLYWAKDLKFTDDSAHTLNYNIRVLGRRG